MNKMVIEMPLVEECMVSACAYNRQNGCHARAITIGDGTHPGCDTFLMESQHTHNKQQSAGIGACKCTACEHNDDFECMTDSVQVGLINNEANCLTYHARA